MKHERLVLLLFLAACGGDVARVTQPPPGASGPPASNPGFDIGVYPGDAIMRAWLPPATPYRWVGFYLPAPCHRDTTYKSKLPTITAMGWGTAAIYVGQQEWEGVPDRFSPDLTDGDFASAPSPACTRTLLSTSEGTLEAGDAAAKMTAEGFPAGSVIFLDVEYMNTIMQPMLDYYGAWLQGVLSDGRFRPGVYCALRNCPTLQSVAAQVYASAGRTDAPDFWVASTTGFDIQRSRPADIAPYAHVWQGHLDVMRTFAGTTLQIDEDVSAAASPSAPASNLRSR